MARALALVLALACLPGCAAWQRSGAPAAVDCLEGKVASQAVLAIPLVLAVVQSGDWEAQLAKLAPKIGADVLACALQHVHLAVPAARPRTGKAARAITYRGLGN